MVLSEKEIREYSKKDIPLISPFCEERLQGASYDISMSGKITVIKNIGNIIDPSKSDSLEDMYETKDLDKSGYLLAPHEYVLVELQEKVIIPENMIAHIRPRTRFTRSGILIADQHCNPTYEGVLQIGLFNVGPNPFLLSKGLSIAQMVFETLESTPQESKLYKNKSNAAYHQEDSFRGAQFGESGWSEEMKSVYREMKNTLKGR